MINFFQAQQTTIKKRLSSFFSPHRGTVVLIPWEDLKGTSTKRKAAAATWLMVDLSKFQ